MEKVEMTHDVANVVCATVTEYGPLMAKGMRDPAGL